MPYKDPAKNAAAKRRYAQSARGKEIQRGYYLAKREEVIKRSAEWGRANPDARRASTRRQYLSNLEKQRERSRLKRRKAYRECPELFIARQHQRRMAKRGVTGAMLRPQEWHEIVETFCGLCAYCLKPTPKPEREHIVPVKRGGTDAYENVVPACVSCNRNKNARGLIQWLQIGGAQ